MKHGSGMTKEERHGLSSIDRDARDRHTARRTMWAAFIAAFATLVASVSGLIFSGLATHQATKQAELAQNAQASERFSRSVEQIGSDSLSVRIGAVYSFDRLMHDSQVDQQAVVEILSTFVHIQADGVPLQGESGKTRTGPVDFLAALKVLDAFWVTGARGDQPSMLLSGVNLSAFVLDSLKMRGADLTGADLTGAHLDGTDLTGADLDGAHLTGADLTGADLTGADLTGAHLDSAHLTGTRLDGAYMDGADLTGAGLTGAYMDGSRLVGADLTGADLSDAHLTYDPAYDLLDTLRPDADLTDVNCSATTIWPKGFNSTPSCK